MRCRAPVGVDAPLGAGRHKHPSAGAQRVRGPGPGRSLLVVGATAVIWQTRCGSTRRVMPWLASLLARKSPKLAAIALANKIARIAWKLMASGAAYDIHRARSTPAAA